MPFNTTTVATAVTPAILSTLVSHYLNRKSLAERPTVHISYDEGFHLIKKFLIYASHHQVEDLQRFTAQWVPHPTWVSVNEVKIDQKYITTSAETIQKQLGHHGIEKVGGKSWWQWRRPGGELKAEWIEMKSDQLERKKNNDPGRRVMLYVHGGAYFFGSVDEHRYQMQRHARKLKARVFAPKYRLAPQFPFPCGLHDCLAAYLYLLTVQDPTTIILAGDSAGGGMVLSMLVTLRDQGLPLPAGAILISPWVDLTHSFPSVAAENPLDYIPPHGFHQRPSPAWPPPNSDDMLSMAESIVAKLTNKDHVSHQLEADAIQGFHVNNHPDPDTENDNAATGTATSDGTGPNANTVPGMGHDLSIMLDGKLVEIKDQIQMYATNQLISHPLVSPVLQPSLGGLPPLLILTGGGEMLRDEQIYIAHKAANPEKYPPGDAFLDENPHNHNRDQVGRWKPTDVQLQVWDDLCHVAPTLSFTRPAKYMYRSVAQFGAWALARAQKTEIEIMDDDNLSVISESDSEVDEVAEKLKPINTKESSLQIGKAGDPLPPFKRHMIRQRVDRHGTIFPLAPETSLPSCNIAREDIGVIKEGPVRKWMAAKREWDTKYASAKRRVQKQRLKEMSEGYQSFGNEEVPPPSALAGRRRQGDQDREEKKKRSYGLSMWSLWGSKHDKETMDREQQADQEPDTVVATAADGANARPLNDTETAQGKRLGLAQPDVTSRSRSRRSTVRDQHQTDGSNEDVDENTPAAELLALKKLQGADVPHTDDFTPAFVVKSSHADLKEQTSPTDLTASIRVTAERQAQLMVPDDHEAKRPKSGGVAFPFTLKRSGSQDGPPGSSASMATLTSATGVMPAKDVRIPAALESGIPGPQDSAGSILNGREGLGLESSSASMATLHTNAGIPPAKDVRIAGAMQSGISEKVVQNGEIVPAGRPELESFVTAMEDLPTTSKS